MKAIFSAKRKKSIISNQARAGVLFVLPTLIIFTIFVFIPLIVSFVFSMLKFDMMFNDIHFIKLDNYVKLFHDKRFFSSLFNTVYYTFVSVPLQVMLSLLVATMISKQTRFNKFLKSVFFIPAICSMTIVAIIWSFLIDKDMGIFAYYLKLLGFQLPALLKDPVLAMPTIIFLGIWKNFGFNMVILIAGIQGVPDSYYEAADIDGATKITQFFKITIPQIMPTMTFVVINSVIASFQVFDQVYVMTKGGPLFKTETVVQYIYKSAFENYDMGYASTVAVILLVITLAVSLYMFKLMRKDEGDFE